MDIESDESERWEDFYGSTTDLIPSVIGYYDKNINNNKTNSSNNKVKHPSSTETNKLTSDGFHNSLSPSKVKKFQVLSAGVQRLLSHSDQSSDEIEYVKNKSTLYSGVPKSTKKSISGTTTVKSSPKSNRTQLPLSKGTSKLTQVVNELTEVLQYSDTFNDTNSADEVSDSEAKTPTNPNTSFLFRTCSLNNNNSSVDTNDNSVIDRNISRTLETSFDADDSGPAIDSNDNAKSELRSIIKRLESISSTSSGDSNTSYRDKMPCVPTNKTYIETDSDDGSFHESNERCSFYVPLQDESVQQRTKPPSSSLSTPSSSPVADRSTVIFKGKPQNSVENQQSGKKSPADHHPPASPKLSYSKQKSLRRNTKDPPSPSSASSSTLSLNPPASPNMSRLTLPLKHRPLSAASISSTSSSSSSGSENSSGKHVVSYLASVESLADHSENELVNSSLTMAERAAHEIIDSERNYVADLGQIINGCLNDWRERNCLSEENLKVLFSNIEQVYEFNKILLKQLINTDMNPIKIAKCFIDLKDEFHVYTEYCTSYPKAISLHTSLQASEETKGLLIATQKSLKHKLPLGAYLLKPVQRILKYHLLLEALGNHCKAPEIEEAHRTMIEVPSNINQIERNLKQKLRVKELAGKLDDWKGPELTVLGELRHEGILMENNKPRNVLLFQTMLMITKPKEDRRLQFKTYIQGKNLMLTEHLPGDVTSFHVIPYDEPRNLIKLTARDRDEKRHWAQLVKQVMLEHFDIPSRAKELVFKLGDEEDRPTDKNIWKWGHSSTPEYLERRNQYRRSEMRYRSKKNRKNVVQASKSLDDGFLNKTVDANRVRSRTVGSVDNLDDKKKCEHRNEGCDCHNVKLQLDNKLKADEMRKAAIDEDEDEKLARVKSTRSKSEPRISNGIYKSQSLHRNNVELPVKSEKKFLTLRPEKSSEKKEKIEIKNYDKKIIPKRIVNLKKKRAKSMKETSKFYTELKITESTDDLTENCVKPDAATTNENSKADEILKERSSSTPQLDEIDGKNKKDSDIISDLLKNNKEFERILNKPPKKKSIDNGRMTSSIESMKSHRESETEMDPGDLTKDDVFPMSAKNREMFLEQNRAITRLNQIQSDLNTSEPIYESLKRNVHVPYKYCPSPLLARSKSQPYPGTPKPKKVERPESDYVTLDFTAVLPNYTTVINEYSQLRNSDSNINYNKVNNSMDSIKNSPEFMFERHESFNHKHSKNLINRFINTRADDQSKKSSQYPEGINFNLKLTQRRVSDVSELCRKSVIYKQGSENLGSRIAHIDYADPKTLFPAAATNNVLINKLSLTPQRDSAFSLTSSSDSVSDSSKSTTIHPKSEPEMPTKSSDDSYYEDNVEACLENDGFFRDSAIYSDDNERKADCVDEMVARPPSIPSPQIPRRSKNSPLSPPPPLPAKPKLKIIGSPNTSGPMSNGSETLSSSSHNHSEAPSWVMQQINNFSNKNK